MGINKRLYYLFYRAAIVVAAAMAVAIFITMPPPAGAWGGALAFALLAVISEFMPVVLPRGLGEVTISVPMHWAAMVLFGPGLAMVAAAVPVPVVNVTGWLSARWLKGHRPRSETDRVYGAARVLTGSWEDRADYPFSWVFELVIANAALDVINVGLAALAYRAAGGYLCRAEHFTSAGADVLMLHIILPFLAGVLIYFFVDEARCVTATVLAEPSVSGKNDWYGVLLRWKILLLDSVRLTWNQYVLLPPVTFLLMYLYVHVGLLSGLVALGPFLAFRLSVQKAIERERVYMDTIATLGTYMQHYHPYTRGHLKRVAKMSERLARELRLPADSVTLIPYAGLLHDIGKVGVSEEILDKVGKLTDEEWATIKEHPVHGAEIISHLEFLDKTVLWIKFHHKWADGSGYPDDGQRNGQVPIEASIIAVADAFDAMTDDREMSLEWVCDGCGYVPEDGGRPEECPRCGAAKRRTYREPLTVDQALDELRRGAGTQFQPEVVKAFLRMVDREGIGVGGSD